MTDGREMVVRIGGVEAGILRYEDEAVTFRLEGDYLESANRPVLGQVFEDDPTRLHRVRSGVPRWFANLLPEGPLRTLIAEAAGVHESREYYLLGHLGEDLPGAVRVERLGESSTTTLDDQVPAEEIERDDSDFQLKFSLAGVQLKFSVLVDGRGATIPVSGSGGTSILKLQDLRYEMVPENEFSMMVWAGEVGIEVPDVALIDVAKVEGLPDEVRESPGKGLLVTRFDRHGDDRIHIEDFAQILDHSPTTQGKYGGANYETIGRILLELSGIEDVHQYVRRLVAMVAMGNGDAHLKNWSVIYPDGRNAQLSPAYDLVATNTLVKARETLALNLGKTKEFESIEIGSFRRMARKLNLPRESAFDDVVKETVARLQTSWLEIRGDLPASPSVKEEIARRLAELPLLQE